MRTVQTRRLRLEPVGDANSEILWGLLQAPHLRDYQELPGAGLEQFKRMVADRPKSMKPRAIGRFEWLIYARSGDAPVGWMSLRLSDRDPVAGEIGYSILHAERGRGYATEAARAIIAEGFESAGLRRIRAYCVPENRASRAVLSKLGFAPDGVLPHGATVAGRAVDILSFVFERQPAVTTA